MKCITRSIIGLAFTAALAACSDPAGVRPPKEGLAPSASQIPTTLNNGLITAVPPGATGTTSPWVKPLGLNATMVYGNVGEGSNGYHPSFGYTVSGPSTVVGSRVVTAHAFVPNGNYTVTGLALALNHVAGPNVYKVSLNADNGGLPGPVIRTWTVANVGFFGSCCSMAVITTFAALPIAQGVQYWVVANPESNTTWGAWNFNSRGATGLTAQNINGTWIPAFLGENSAFAVFGRAN